MLSKFSSILLISLRGLSLRYYFWVSYRLNIASWEKPLDILVLWCLHFASPNLWRNRAIEKLFMPLKNFSPKDVKYDKKHQSIFPIYYPLNQIIRNSLMLESIFLDHIWKCSLILFLKTCTQFSGQFDFDTFIENKYYFLFS